jgi:hypothetical protein
MLLPSGEIEAPDRNSTWVVKLKATRAGFWNCNRTLEMLCPGESPPVGTFRFTKGLPDGSWPDGLARVTVVGVRLEITNTSGAFRTVLELFLIVTKLLKVLVARFKTKPDLVMVT